MSNIKKTKPARPHTPQSFGQPQLPDHRKRPRLAAGPVPRSRIAMSRDFNGPVGVHRFHHVQCLRVAKGTLPYQVSGVGISLSELTSAVLAPWQMRGFALSSLSTQLLRPLSATSTALFLICAWSTTAALNYFGAWVQTAVYEYCIYQADVQVLKTVG
jgi:hypothetical protein